MYVKSRETTAETYQQGNEQGTNIRKHIRTYDHTNTYVMSITRIFVCKNVNSEVADSGCLQTKTRTYARVCRKVNEHRFSVVKGTNRQSKPAMEP